MASDPRQKKNPRLAGDISGVGLPPAPAQDPPFLKTGNEFIDAQHLGAHVQQVAARQAKDAWDRHQRNLGATLGVGADIGTGLLRRHRDNTELLGGTRSVEADVYRHGTAAQKWMQDDLSGRGVSLRASEYLPPEQLAELQRRREVELYGQNPDLAYFDPRIDIEDDPSYQWRFQEGQKAALRAANARGGIGSGATLKALQRFGQGMASQEYASAHQRALQNYMANRQTGQQNIDNRMAAHDRNVAIEEYNRNLALQDYLTNRDTNQLNEQRRMAAFETSEEAQQRAFNNIRNVQEAAKDAGLEIADRAESERRDALDDSRADAQLGSDLQYRQKVFETDAILRGLEQNSIAAAAGAAGAIGGANKLQELNYLSEQERNQFTNSLLSLGATVAGFVFPPAGLAAGAAGAAAGGGAAASHAAQMRHSLGT